jgi:hypothetical protein
VQVFCLEFAGLPVVNPLPNRLYFGVSDVGDRLTTVGGQVDDALRGPAFVNLRARGGKPHLDDAEVFTREMVGALIKQVHEANHL